MPAAARGGPVVGHAVAAAIELRGPDVGQVAEPEVERPLAELRVPGEERRQRPRVVRHEPEEVEHAPARLLERIEDRLDLGRRPAPGRGRAISPPSRAWPPCRAGETRRARPRARLGVWPHHSRARPMAKAGQAAPLTGSPRASPGPRRAGRRPRRLVERELEQPPGPHAPAQRCPRRARPRAGGRRCAPAPPPRPSRPGRSGRRRARRRAAAWATRARRGRGAWKASTPARLGPTKTAAPTAPGADGRLQARGSSARDAPSPRACRRPPGSCRSPRAPPARARRTRRPTRCALLRLAQDLGADARLHHAATRLSKSFRPSFQRPCSTQYTAMFRGPLSGGSKQVLAQHAVLLAADQDLAGQQQHVGLAAVLRDQLGHAGLGALGHREGAAGPGLVEREDLERRGALRCPAEQPQHRRGRPG